MYMYVIIASATSRRGGEPSSPPWSAASVSAHCCPLIPFCGIARPRTDSLQASQSQKKSRLSREGRKPSPCG